MKKYDLLNGGINDTKYCTINDVWFLTRYCNTSKTNNTRILHHTRRAQEPLRGPRPRHRGLFKSHLKVAA